MTLDRCRRRGFTLIEILVVIIVLGLLAALVGPQIFGRVSEAKTATARTQIELLGLALDNYRLDNGCRRPRSPSAPATWRGPRRSPFRRGSRRRARARRGRAPCPRPPSAARRSPCA